jgi:hypothetical protein
MQGATDTIDYVATDTWGNTSTRHPHRFSSLRRFQASLFRGLPPGGRRETGIEPASKASSFSFYFFESRPGCVGGGVTGTTLLPTGTSFRTIGSHSPTHIFTFLTVPTSSQPGSSVGGFASTAPNALVEKTSATVTRTYFISTLHASYIRTNKSASKFSAMTNRFLLTGLVMVCIVFLFEVGELRTTMASFVRSKKLHRQWNFF